MEQNNNVFPQGYRPPETTKALPEPRRVKREILYARNKAQETILEQLSNPSGTSVQSFYKILQDVGKFYMNVHSYMSKFATEKKYDKLREVRESLKIGRVPSPDKLKQKHIDELIDVYYILDELIYELGITKIGLETTDDYEFGYDFLEGLEFDIQRENEGWRRLLQNIRGINKLLREDTDFMIVVTGGNRVGKDTMALLLCHEADPDFNRERIVVDDNDFWNVVNDSPQYSWAEITELSDHFYSKDAMKGEQKKKKRKLKKFAAKNMCLVGCDVNWFNIDKEVRQDKVKVNIHIPRRGYFEFYPSDLLDSFERDEDTGKAVRPDPAFTGRFPKAEGADRVERLKEEYDDKQDVGKHLKEEEDDGRDLRLYEDYVVKEWQKFQVEGQGVEEGEELTVQEVVKAVKKEKDYYKSEYKGRVFIDKDLIKAKFDFSEEKAKQVKKVVEKDLGINE